jgi:DNA-binding SARP family transcriptional activator
VEFRILGPLEVVDDGGAPVDLGGPKQRAVLTILLVERGHVGSVERLIERLWGDEPPSSAVGSLQAYVSNLRRALEPDRSAGAKASVLVTQAPGYRLDVPDDAVDVTQYERLVADGEAALARGDVERAATALRSARALWRGAPLAEVAYETFARGEVERLEELRLVGVEAWARTELLAGRHAAVVGELEALVMANPLRSQLRRDLMLALYRSGRQADALRVYKEGRAILRDELGVEPDADLQALEEQILLQSPDLDWVPRSATTTTAHPPTQSRFSGQVGHENASVLEDRETGAAGAPLVGRDREVAVLDRALIESASGRGRIVLVAGEPGIGKTRLAEAVVDRARARGSSVGWSRSFEAEGVPAFWPWVQIVRGVVERVPDDVLVAAAGSGAGEIARLVPELAPRLGVAEPEPSTGRFAVYDAVSRLLVALSTTAPIVVVLDDAQWADVASLRLLEYVAGEIRSARVLVVAAFRDAEQGEALGATLATLAPLPHVERLTVGGLPEGDVGRIVAGVLEREPDAELVAVVAQRTGGNPFFVRELVRLIESSAVDAVPPTVREVIDRRLARLPDAVRALLSAAAVAGRDFDVRVAASVAALSEDDALDAIDEAVAARLVDEGDVIGRYVFAHALVQETIVASLSRTRQARLHAALADLLLPRAEAGHPELLPEVAHHALEGALPGREADAVRLAAKAAVVAIRGLAFEDAAGLCERALAIAARLPDSDAVRFDLQLALGWARRDGGDDVAGRAALKDAQETARALDDAERFARASIGFSGSVWWSWWTDLGYVDSEAVAALEEAVERLPATPSRRRVEVLGRLASQLYFDPTARQRREAASLEAVEAARTLNDDRTLANALVHRHAAIWEPGRPAERYAIAVELTEIGRRLRWPATQLLGHQLQYSAALERNDGREFEAQVVAADEYAAKTPPHLRIHQDWAESMVALLRGDLAAAERIMNAVFESTARWDAAEAMRTWATHLGQLRYDQGRFAELIEPLRNLSSTEEVATGWQSGLVLMLAADGRLDEARAEWKTLLDMEDAPDDSNLSWLFNDGLRAEAAYLLGDGDVAAALLDRLTPLLGLNIVLFTRELYAGPVSLCVGSLESCLERWTDAIAHLDQAVDETSALGARSWRARSLLRLGEALRASGESARAHDVLADARREAEALGMAAVARRATEAVPSS